MGAPTNENTLLRDSIDTCVKHCNLKQLYNHILELFWLHQIIPAEQKWLPVLLAIYVNAASRNLVKSLYIDYNSLFHFIQAFISANAYLIEFISGEYGGKNSRITSAARHISQSRYRLIIYRHLDIPLTDELRHYPWLWQIVGQGMSCRMAEACLRWNLRAVFVRKICIQYAKWENHRSYMQEESTIVHFGSDNSREDGLLLVTSCIFDDLYVHLQPTRRQI